MILLLPVLVPVIGGALSAVLPFKSRKAKHAYVEAITIANSIMLLYLLWFTEKIEFRAYMTEQLMLWLRIDGMTRVFGTIIAVLWPFASLYAFAYMEHEGKEKDFFSYYTMSYGVTAGIAMSASMFTMYVFYELLTIVTLPLVLHRMNAISVYAGRRYLYYSIGGAALAFAGMIYLHNVGVRSTEFMWGGILRSVRVDKEVLRTLYVLAFIGFGAKAAVFPMHSWLPKVSVAPTPVTALLHAVAVVKAGAFAVLRMTYYGFGTAVLVGSWAQYTVIGLASFTIIYGSVMSLKERHLKRRLAWSTVSNLSYILLGAGLMTTAGMAAALQHMIYHAVVKCTLFFCAGAIQTRAEYEYINECNSIGRRMPRTMLAFTFASCALCGIPPLAPFISKWALAEASVDSGMYIGLAALIVSAILTAFYLLPVCVRAFTGSPSDNIGPNCEPDWRMLLPIGFLCVLTLVISFYTADIYAYLVSICG